LIAATHIVQRGINRNPFDVLEKGADYDLASFRVVEQESQ
jgi:hypothetical protein